MNTALFFFDEKSIKIALVAVFEVVFSPTKQKFKNCTLLALLARSNDLGRMSFVE